MARFRLMYWKEIPVQVQAEDESGQVSRPLDERFQQAVDAVSMLDGSSGTDDYLSGWSWGEHRDMEGSADDVAETVAGRFNRGFPIDAVARIRRLHESGRRDPSPGAVDHWVDHDPS